MNNIEMINVELKKEDVYNYFDAKPENIEKLKKIKKQEKKIFLINTLSFYDNFLSIFQKKPSKNKSLYQNNNFIKRFFLFFICLIMIPFTFWLFIPAVVLTKKFKNELNQFLNEREKFVQNIFSKKSEIISNINQYLNDNGMVIFQYDNFQFKIDEIFDKNLFFKNQNISFQEFIKLDIPYPLVNKIKNTKSFLAQNNQETYTKWRLSEYLLKWYEYKSDFLVYSEIKKERLALWINSVQSESSLTLNVNSLNNFISFLYSNINDDYLAKIDNLENNSFLPYSTKKNPDNFLVQIDEYFSFIFNQIESLLYFNNIGNIYDVIVNGNSNLLLNDNKSNDNIQKFGSEEEFYVNSIFNIILQLGSSVLKNSLFNNEIYLDKLPFDLLVNNNIWPFNKYNFLSIDSSTIEVPLIVDDININYPSVFKLDKKINFDQLKKYIQNLKNNLNVTESETLLNNLVSLRDQMQYIVSDDIKNNSSNLINEVSSNLLLQFKNTLDKFYAIKDEELNDIFSNLLKKDYNSLIYIFLLVKNFNDNSISDTEVINDYKHYYVNYFSSIIDTIKYKVQSNIKIENYLIPNDVKNSKNFEGFGSLISNIKKSYTDDELHFLNELIFRLETFIEISINNFIERLNNLKKLYDSNVYDLSNNLKEILLNISNAKKIIKNPVINGQVFIKNDDFSNKNLFIIRFTEFINYIKNNISSYLFLFNLQFTTNSMSIKKILNSISTLDEEYYKDYKLLGSYFYSVNKITFAYDIEKNSKEKALKFINSQEDRTIPLNLKTLNMLLKENGREIIDIDNLMKWLVNYSGFADLTIDSMIKELRETSSLEHTQLIQILTDILFVNI